MPTSQNNRRPVMKKPPAKKQWKAAPSKLSETSASKPTEIVAKLKELYPNAHCELNYKNAFELLIATILSAQCTDVRVNQVTSILFAEYPTPQLLARAPLDQVELIVRPTGFFKNKALNIKKCSELLVSLYKGDVPKSLEKLIELPGVGRKTANVVLGNAFGITSGVVVDTHVSRLSNRFGWVKSDNPIAIEEKLQKIIPYEDWILISHLLIWHGRKVCKARSPDCSKCAFTKSCPKKGVQSGSSRV